MRQACTLAACSGLWRQLRGELSGRATNRMPGQQHAKVQQCIGAVQWVRCRRQENFERPCQRNIGRRRTLCMLFTFTFNCACCEKSSSTVQLLHRQVS